MAPPEHSLAAAFRSLALPVALLLAGCATTPENPLLPDEKEALASRRVAVVRRTPPRFGLYKKSDAWTQTVAAPFGVAAVVGAGAAVLARMYARNDPIAAEYKLPDPAHGIAAQLGRTFGPAYGATFVGLTEEVLTEREPAEVFSALQGVADFALDIRTDHWGLGTSIVGGYRFTYGASFVLLDLHEGVVVASGACRHLATEREARAFDEMMRDNAAQLRVEIDSAAKVCAETFAEKILGEMATTPVVPPKSVPTHRHQTPR